MMPQKVSLIEVAVIIIWVCFLGLLLWTLTHTRVEFRALPVWNEVPQIKEVVHIKKVLVAMKSPNCEIQTYEKVEVTKALELPPVIASNPDVQVIASAEVPPSQGVACEAKTDIITIMNVVTGESKIEYRPRPLPFFAFKHDKEIGARYGFTTRGEQEAELYGRWTFLRMSSLFFALYSEVTTGPEGKLMLDVGYRW